MKTHLGISDKTIRENYTPYYEKQWIDAGGNPAVRHEGGAPSNNLIKDAPPPGNSFRWADPEVIVLE